MPVAGGARLKAYLAQQKNPPEVWEVKVGFFSPDKYPDEKPVPAVAAAHEFGLGVPQRPFMRPAIAETKDCVRRLLRQRIDPRMLTVARANADALDELVVEVIRQKITSVREPALAPSTRRRRGGNANPLADTRRLSRSVRHEII